MVTAIDAIHLFIEMPLPNLISLTSNYMFLAFGANSIFVGFSVDVPNEDVSNSFF